MLIAAIIWGVRYLAYSTTHETTDDARVDADTVTVTSKIQERVAQILVDTNQPVRKGQVLIRLDATDERAALQQATSRPRRATRASARRARKRRADARAGRGAGAQGAGGVAAARSQIQRAGADVRGAAAGRRGARRDRPSASAAARRARAGTGGAAALARANADLARYTALVRTGDIASQQLDAQRATQAQAQAQYRAALDNVTAAQTGVAQAQARYTAASTVARRGGRRRRAARTARDRARPPERSDNPYRVSATQAQADAAFAQAGSLQAQVQDGAGPAQLHRDPLADRRRRRGEERRNGRVRRARTIADDARAEQRLYITANYKETQLGKVRVGRPVDVGVDAYKGVDVPRSRRAIAPASQNTFSLVPAQNATGNFVKVTQRIPVRIWSSIRRRTSRCASGCPSRRRSRSSSRDDDDDSRTAALALSAAYSTVARRSPRGPAGARATAAAQPAAPRRTSRAPPLPPRSPRPRAASADAPHRPPRPATPPADDRRSQPRAATAGRRKARHDDVAARQRAAAPPRDGGAQGGGLPPPPLPAVLPPVPNIAPGFSAPPTALPNGELVGVQQQPFVGLDAARRDRDGVAAQHRSRDRAVQPAHRELPDRRGGRRLRRALPARAVVPAQRHAGGQPFQAGPGGGPITQDTAGVTAALQGATHNGGRYSVGLTGTRVPSNSAVNSYDPFYHTALQLSVTQPLLRGRAADQTRLQLQIARTNALIQSDVALAQASNTVVQVSNAY